MKIETLKINGLEKQFPAGSLPPTIEQLLKQLNINTATVVAEINGRIIEPDKFANTNLVNGQCIELIKFVPGG